MRGEELLATYQAISDILLLIKKIRRKFNTKDPKDKTRSPDSKGKQIMTIYHAFKAYIDNIFKALNQSIYFTAHELHTNTQF